jgi:hypothetical protein
MLIRLDYQISRNFVFFKLRKQKQNKGGKDKDKSQLFNFIAMPEAQKNCHCL